MNLRFVLVPLLGCATAPTVPTVERAVVVPEARFQLLEPATTWFGAACRPWGAPSDLHHPLIVTLDDEAVAWPGGACRLADGACERAVTQGLWALRAAHDQAAWDLRACHAEAPLGVVHVWLRATPDASAEVAASFARESAPYAWWLQVEAAAVVEDLRAPCPPPAPGPVGTVQDWANALGDQLAPVPAARPAGHLTMVELLVEDRPRRYDCDDPR